MKPEIKCNESVGSVHIPVIRSGDASGSMTVLCTTVSRTAIGSTGKQLLTGTDYISREEYIVRFEEGETISNCDIRVCCIEKFGA